METILSRYNIPRHIEVFDANNYLIWGNSEYLRHGDDYVDYEGGPFIQKGQPLYDGDERIIVDIKPYTCKSKYNCYKITVV